MNVSDVCECSCQNYLEISNYNLTSRKLINKASILGKMTYNNNYSFQIHIYDDGSVEKKYIIR